MADSELTHEREKTQRFVWGALLAIVSIGLCASCVLLVDYLRPVPLFCSEEGGCGQLRRSAYAHMFGVPTPAIGVLGYVVLGALTLLRGDIARFLQLIAAMFGALVAAYLLFLQVSLDTFCAYCMTVDLASIVILSLVLIRVRTEADGETWQVTAFGGAVARAGVAAIPFLSRMRSSRRACPTSSQKR